MTRDILLTSMLPPLTRAATFLLRMPETLPFMRAATGTAPAPSATVLNAFDEPEDCCGNFRFVDCYDVVDIFLADFIGQVARRFYRNAVS